MRNRRGIFASDSPSNHIWQNLCQSKISIILRHILSAHSIKISCSISHIWEMLFLRRKNIRSVIHPKFSDFYDVSLVIIKIRPRRFSALLRSFIFCAFANAFNCLKTCVFLCIYLGRVVVGAAQSVIL